VTLDTAADDPGNGFAFGNYRVASTLGPTFINGGLVITNNPITAFTNVAPGDAVTIKGWMDVTNNGLLFKIPLYQ